MFEFQENKVPYTYNESGQRNPIRWEVLYREGDVFIPQTALIRCKDYFNDIASVRNGGPGGRVHGFVAADVKTNNDGVWVRLHNLTNNFFTNMDNIVNGELSKEIPKTEIHRLTETTALIRIDPFFFQHTYLISLYTHLLRGMNYGDAYASFEEVFKGPLCSMESVGGAYYLNRLFEWRFSVPEELKEYYWWYNSAENSKKLTADRYIHLVHNNGWMSWVQNYNHLHQQEEEDYEEEVD